MTPTSPERQNGLTNTILHGNCIETMHRMPTNSVDFILTDPPYLVNYRDRTGRSIPNDANPTRCRDIFGRPIVLQHRSFRFLQKGRVPDRRKRETADERGQRDYWLLRGMEFVAAIGHRLCRPRHLDGCTVGTPTRKSVSIFYSVNRSECR
jgi:hypothetical protein